MAPLLHRAAIKRASFSLLKNTVHLPPLKSATVSQQTNVVMRLPVTTGSLHLSRTSIAAAAAAAAAGLIRSRRRLTCRLGRTMTPKRLMHFALIHGQRDRAENCCVQALMKAFVCKTDEVFHIQRGY